MRWSSVLDVFLLCPACLCAPNGLADPIVTGHSLRQILVDDLFLGIDPLQMPWPNVGPLKDQMTHVSAKDIRAVLASIPEPAGLWVELGAFEGGSAILTAREVKKRGWGDKMVVIAVDTFVGDLHTVWEKSSDVRSQMLRPDGTIKLYDYFRANVGRASCEDVILPLPATSVVALRLLNKLAQRNVTPMPWVIYLDSAHEEGEVLLELQLAWKVLAPGGFLFGDDWILPGPREGDEGPVQRDVLRFAATVQTEVDNDFGDLIQPMRTLGRVRHGLFVSYNSFQWFMKKRLQPTRETLEAPVTTSTNIATIPGATLDCWSSGYSPKKCCNETQFGNGGNKDCWDIVFTFDRCCFGND